MAPPRRNSFGSLSSERRPPIRPRRYSQNDITLSLNNKPFGFFPLESLVKTAAASHDMLAAGQMVGMALKAIETLVLEVLQNEQRPTNNSDFQQTWISYISNFVYRWNRGLWADVRSGAREHKLELHILTIRRWIYHHSRAMEASPREKFVFLRTLLRVRYMEQIRKQSLDLSGYIAYRKAELDEPWESASVGRIHLRVRGTCHGLLKPYRVSSESDLDPDTSKYWLANDVFLAGKLQALSVQFNPGTDYMSYREIVIEDLGRPLSATHGGSIAECNICYEAPEYPKRPIAVHGCNHVYCAECLLMWANQVLSPNGPHRISCPACRGEIRPRDTPLAFFVVAQRDQHTPVQRYRRCWRYYENFTPSHPYYGIANGWEEDEVDAFVNLLYNWRGIGPKWDGIMLKSRFPEGAP